MRQKTETTVPGIFIAVAALGLAACGAHQTAELSPATSARTVWRQPDRAVAQESGVRITADPQAWGARPADLDRTMTPVQVTIQNRSGKPLRLSYDEFVLVTPDGKEYQPESPFRIDGSERPIATPMLDYDRFAVAPRYAPFYPGVEVWPDSITPAEQVTSNRWTTTWSDPLPTDEMLSLALPEGVLKPGGKVAGFVYFPKVDASAGRVEFRADLDNAETGGQVATIAIPFLTGHQPG